MATSKVAAIAFAGIAALLPAAVSYARYTVGSIQGQDGWNGGSVAILPPIDQGITNAAHNTGFQSWHISNSTVNGFSGFGVFGGMPHSPNLSVANLTVAAGQPSSGAAADTFQFSFYFKAASTNTAGDGSWLQVDIADANSDDRSNFFGIKNIADGVKGGLQFREAESVNTPAEFLSTQTITSAITRTDWHHIVVTGHYLDGPGNDYFTVSFDESLLNNPNGSSPNAGTSHFFTFEGYRNQESLPYQQVGRIFFAPSQSGSTTDSVYMDTDPQGYYIDDLTYSVFNSSDPNTILASFDSQSFEVPEPSIVGALSLGALGLIARRRRSLNG